MAGRQGPHKNGDALDIVADLTGAKASDLMGFVVVGIRTDSNYEILSNGTSMTATAMILADVLKMIMGNMATAEIATRTN